MSRYGRHNIIVGKNTSNSFVDYILESFVGVENDVYGILKHK
jgi:hypothetical protein